MIFYLQTKLAKIMTVSDVEVTFFD